MAGAAGTAGAQQEDPPQEIGGGPELAGVERLGSLRRWAARVLAGLVLVLAVSGAYLWFRYTPTSASSWPGLADGASRAKMGVFATILGRLGLLDAAEAVAARIEGEIRDSNGNAVGEVRAPLPA